MSDKYLSSEPTDLKSDDSSEQLRVKLQVKGAPDLYIGSFYRPPTITDDECLMHLEKNIQRIRQNNNSQVWLGGDFNLGGIEWHNYSIKSKALNTKQCKQLLDICQDNCLEQVVNEETHFTEKSKSIFDLFFTSNSSLINKVEVIPGISDHEIVYVEASIKPRKVNKPPRKVYQYNKANTEELKEKFRSIDIEKQLKEQDLIVDLLWNNFKEKVLDIMNQSIPTKRINNSKRKLPWINREMKSLTTKRNKYFKKMK